MRLLTWIYALLALAACLWLGLQWRDSSRADPRALLDLARQSILGPELDYKRGLQQLGLALEAAEGARDMPLIEEILLARARLLKGTGGFTQARADLERVLTHFRPGSPAVGALLAAIDLDAGETQAALARADLVLEKDHNQAEAWGVRAHALLTLAERRLEACRARAGLALADAGLDRADQLMRRIAARETDDVDRAPLVDALYAAFPGSEKHRAREVLDELDEASHLLAGVPIALAESFRGAVRRDTVQLYLKVLRDAGEVGLAAEFGLGVAKLPALASYPPFLRALMETLVDAGRLQAAADVVDPALGKKAAPDAGFFQVWSDVLYRAGKWRTLAHAANLMRATGDPDQRSISSFYLGMAQARLAAWEPASVALQRYVTRGPIEPFAGALAIAWQTLAEAHRAREQPDEELAALRRRLALSPDRYPGVGEVWLRRADIALSVAPIQRIEALGHLTQALRLMPERRAELEPRWSELGSAIAVSQHVDIEAECRTLEERGISFPEGRRTPYELVAIARQLIERREFAPALAIAHRTLEQYPDLLPALDVLARAAEGAGEVATAAESYRRSLEVGGPDVAVVEALVALPLDELGPRWPIDMVRLDPEGFGRRWAAERLRERGALDEAIAGLQRVAPGRLGDGGRSVLAQLLYDQGRDEEAQAQLAALTPAIDVLARALPLMIDIGIRQRDTQHISTLLPLLEARTPIDTPALIACVDHMLLAGMVESARELTLALDQRRNSRCAALYLRMAQVELLSGDIDAAADALDRALPYDDAGAADLGFVLVAVERRRWSELPTLVRALRETALDATPLQYIALEALGERISEARAAAAQGHTDLPEETLWPLFDAALAALGRQSRGDAPAVSGFPPAQGFGIAPDGGVERDPRPLLARVAALAHPEWAAWAVADLERSKPPAPGALWPTYLAALGSLWLGQAPQSEALARTMTASWPSFVPAWDLVQQAIESEVRRSDHPRILRLANQRRNALGAPAVLDADEFGLEARALEATGDHDGALRALDRALALEPEREDLLHRKAQIHGRLHDWNAAIDAFEHSLASTEDETDNRSVAEFVGLLEEACAADPAALERPTRVQLDLLAAHFPEDPRVALAIARRALPPAARPGRVDSALAVAVLEDFRRRTAQRSLDELRAGSALAWAEFYATFDVPLAHSHVLAELEREPASVELWRKRAQLARRLGNVDEAVAAAETATRMLPDPDTARLLARLCAERGDDVESVRARVLEAARIAGTSPDDRPLALALALALVHGDRAQLAEGLTILQRLWDTRDAAARPDEFVDVGALYGLASCRRGEAADRPVAQRVLKEVAPRVADPLERSLLVAMTSISRYIGP